MQVRSDVNSKPSIPVRVGRPVVPDADRLRIYNIRLTQAQIEKLAQLGGAPWIRSKINKARIPVGRMPIG